VSARGPGFPRLWCDPLRCRGCERRSGSPCRQSPDWACASARPPAGSRSLLMLTRKKAIRM
jgi:hypothetical protein